MLFVNNWYFATLMGGWKVNSGGGEELKELLAGQWGTSFEPWLSIRLALSYQPTLVLEGLISGNFDKYRLQFVQIH